MRIERKILVLFLLAVTSSLLIVKAQEQKKLSKWEDERMLNDFNIWSLLVKKGGYGSGIPESQQWRSGRTLTDTEREPALEKILKDYPKSDYADDAALLLARAKLLYHKDASGAIKDLYKVISDYPNGNWIAEDGIWLQVIPVISYIDRDGKRLPRTPLEERPTGLTGKMFVYLEYLEKEPHKTADEAKYWIAKIILSTDLKDTRYEEAIRNLQEVVEKYKNPDLKRSAKDFAAIGNFKDPFFSGLMRAEQKCQHLLIKAYLAKKEYSKAADNAEDYLSVYEGHSACEEIEMSAGEAYEALQQWDKAAFHYEKFLSFPRLANETRDKYEQKLSQMKNKRR